MSMVSVIKDRLVTFLKSRAFLRIIYLVLLVFVTVNVSKHGGALSYVSFYIVVFYPIISYAYLLYSAFAITIYQETDKRIVDKNTPEKYRLTIQNTGIFPIANIRFGYDESVTHFSKDFTLDTYKLLAREAVNINTEMIFKFAGGYDSGIVWYSIEDLFGIMSIKRNVKTPVRNHVLPAITDAANEEIERINSESASVNRITLNRPDDTFGNDIRKYEKGDPLNTVHWKNYAKTGELYVRIPDNPESEMICIVTVTEVMDGSLDSLIKRDIFLEYLVSLVNYFGMNKKPVAICYYKLGVKTYIVDSLDSFHDFYVNILSDIGSKPAAGHEEDMVKFLSGKYDNVVFVRENTEV